MAQNNPPRNNPYREKAILGLWMVQDALWSLLEDHENPDAPPCDCMECEDNQGLLFMTRQMIAILESRMFTLAPALLQLRAHGFPAAHHLAEMILSRFGSEPDDPDSAD